MSANNAKFTGWSGETFDLSKLEAIISPRTISEKKSSIVEGPVVITPRVSGNTLDSRFESVVKQRSVNTGSTNSSRSLNTPLSLNIPQSLNIPFTAGTIDTTFPYENESGFNGPVYSVTTQPDGKILVGGDFNTYYYGYGNSWYSPRLIRLNSDGTIDEDFYVGDGLDSPVYTIEVQPDGKILVGGNFDYYYQNNNYLSPKIIRLLPNGDIDGSFFNGNSFDGKVYKIILQPDGKILVGGKFSTYQNIPSRSLIRLNSNGSIDTSFFIGDSTVTFNDEIQDIAIQSDGKILCGGLFQYYSGISQNYIIRLNTDGTKDTTFEIGSGFNGNVYTISLQSDGKIVVGGSFFYYNGNDLFGGNIVRLKTDGTLDTKFGYGLDTSVYKIVIQSDDKILAGGDFKNYFADALSTLPVNRIIRFYSDCSFDYSFDYDVNIPPGNAVFDITLTSDNKILIGGDFSYGGDPYLLNYFGRLNNSISVYPYTYTVQACAQPLLDETIYYVVGSMIELNPFVTYSFQSLQNPSITVCGYLVDIFPSNIVEYSMVNTYADCKEAYTSNYKLVTVTDCAGDYPQSMPFWVVDNKYEIGDILYIDLLLYDSGQTYFNKFAGTIITEIPMSEGLGIWDYLPAINYTTYSSCDEAINNNGMIYGADSCNQMEGSYPLIHKIIYGPTSTLLPTGDNPVKIIYTILPWGPYEYISGGTSEIYSFIKLSDFSENYEYNNICDKGLTKMSPIGILNNTFNDNNTGFGGDLVYTTVEQPDGKILVGGNFNDYLGVTVGNFMRINPDGTLDETFYLGIFSSYIRAIALQPDGKILVGGNFSNYDGYNAGRIIRLNSDGTIDSGFTFNTEFDNIVRAIAIQRDGKIVVGGGFNTYYNFPCPQIVRLNSDGTPDPTFIMGDGFDGDQVYTINIETIRDTPFYVTNGPITYTENIVVGGSFTWYNGTTVRGIVKLSPTGEVLPDFGEGFNTDVGNSPRVNQILTQPDGKLVIIGGGVNNGYLRDYNGTWIPQNIVRLVKVNGIYQIDSTFTTRNFDNGGGFDSSTEGAALSISLLPNGKYMIGGQFNYYGDNNNDHVDLPYLIRLNSNGTLDETFTFEITQNNVNKVLLLSSGVLLVGGWFYTPASRLLQLFIGEEYELRTFDTCDGDSSNIFLPTGYQVQYNDNTVTSIPYSPIDSGLLTLVDLSPYTPPVDDRNYHVELPMDFDVDFLGQTYTSVFVGTNSYITFGGGASCYGLVLPDMIPKECSINDGPGPGNFSTGLNALPGIVISTLGFENFVDNDTELNDLYTGSTDGGNNTVIRFEGIYYADRNISQNTTVIFNYIFYKDNPGIIDIVIEQNPKVGGNNPLGGISDGSSKYVNTFTCNSQTSWRISPSISSVKPIKADVNDTPLVCGQVGSVILTAQTYPSYSLFTATNTTNYNTCEDCGQVYKTILYVRDGANPNYVTTSSMSLNTINNVLTNGPIFTARGPECYEILKYTY